MTLFYDDLIDLPELDSQLAAHISDPTERAEVLAILDASLHHVVMDVIFTALPTDQHELFLVQFHSKPADRAHFDFLRRYHPTIEEAIREAAATSKRQFIDTIHAS